MTNNLSTLKESLEKRHSHYNIGSEWVSPKEEVVKMLEDVLNLVPTHFNAQTVRMILLTGEKHKEHWTIIENAFINIMGVERYEAQTKEKIHTAFMSGAGTVLFFDDVQTTKDLQEQFPAYAGNFPSWALQVQGSHQFATWIGLTELGFGASLQHYIGMVDGEVKEHAGASEKWEFIGHMPFGNPLSNPTSKPKKDIKEVLKVF